MFPVKVTVSLLLIEDGWVITLAVTLIIEFNHSISAHFDQLSGQHSNEINTLYNLALSYFVTALSNTRFNS